MYDHQEIKDSKQLLKTAEVMLSDSELSVSAMANISALLKQYYPEANWIGFYLAKEEMLYLGPFQGLSACQFIPFGKGVCGTAAITKKTQIVKDVTELENHISCDSSSLSEIVVPIIINNQVYGVLDIDSPFKASFSIDDQRFLEELMEILIPYLK